MTRVVVEMLIRVFRTYKGEIEKGIAGSVRIRNPQTLKQSDPFYFTAKEFTIDSLLIPTVVNTTTVDGGTSQISLYDDLVQDGQVEIVLQCLEPAQYYGVAQADFYMRAGSGSFAWNYAKCCFGIWLTMLVVTAMGVGLSTFLAGPIALLASLMVILIGQFREFVERLFASQITGDATIAPGGGPIESLYRIATQMSITVDLEQTPVVAAMKTLDTFLLAPMRLGAGLFPSLSNLDTSNFVASGFDIPADLVAEQAVQTAGYVLVMFVLGAFFLRSREVASS